MGAKCEASREYGACDSESNHESEIETKSMNEGYLKVPKTFKDLLDNLHSLYPHVSISKLETVGNVHSGLFCQVLRVDRSSFYITRVTRFNPSTICNSVAGIGESVLSALYASYTVREIVLSVQKACSVPHPSNINLEGPSWLAKSLKTNPSAIITPLTSTSDFNK